MVLAVGGTAAVGQPDPMRDSFLAMIAARALIAGVTLGVFDALAEVPLDPDGLAERLDLDPVGVDALLAALRALGYVELDGGDRYRLTGVAAQQLVSDSPDSVATFVGAMNVWQWDGMAKLEDVVRSGRSYGWHEFPPGHPMWESYIRGLYEASRAEHDANAACVPAEDAQRMVDVAGGHGAFAMAMCRRHPGLRATIVELPASAAVGRLIVEEQGFADRIDYLEGDVFELDLGDGLDVVSAFNLVHHLSSEQNAELLRRARAALRPGGCVVIGDSERPEPGAPVSQHGALSGLLFYAMSASRTFTVAEISGWIEAAGFQDVAVHRNERSPWRVLVVGR